MLACYDHNGVTRCNANIGAEQSEIDRTVIVIGTQKVAGEVAAVGPLEIGERAVVGKEHPTALS